MKIRSNYLLSLVSGCIIGISIRYSVVFFLIWIGFIPLFVAIKNTKPRFSLIHGLLAGIGCSLFMLNWLITITARYMGNSIIYGVMAFVLIAFLYSIRFSLFAYLFSKFRILEKPSSIINIMLVAAIWVVLEYINAMITATFPWITFHLGYVLTCCPQFIQVAEFSGVFGVSFLIIVINFVFYLFIITKKRSYMYASIAILIVQFLFGWLIMHNIPNNGQKVKIAIIQENIPAKLRWNENMPESIVEKYYLSPLSEAVKHQPNLILWSETAIPWKFFQDDNLVYDFLNISWSTQAGHIIGMHSEVPNKPDKTYNSAFYIHPDGAVTGKYDKMYPLTFLEAPVYNGDKLGNLMLPFFKKSVLNIEPGTRLNLLKTPYGNIGMSICNESLLGFHARNSVKAGANFLMVMSNDAWFADTRFPYYHFTHMMMRAVENRRDVAVNSNVGYAAIVNASGEIVTQNISDQPTVINGFITQRNQKTFYTTHGDVFSMVCIAFVIIFIIRSFISKKIKGD